MCAITIVLTLVFILDSLSSTCYLDLSGLNQTIV